jgi:predicted Zn-dependent protease
MKRKHGPHRFPVPAGILLLTLLPAACTTVPVTGRRQLDLIPGSTMLSMSDQQYAEFLGRNPLSQNQDQTAMVRRVGARIQNAVERYFRSNGMHGRLNGYEWEFNLVESDEANAWAMPGGKVVVYTGILPVTRTEPGLAVVMGHEIAHAVAEHGNERMSQGLLSQLGGMALSEALAEKPRETRNLWLTAFGAGVQIGALLPYSRLQETEADHLGLIFMAMAGYDPDEALSFWQRMAENKSGPSPPVFLSTHPSDQSRIARIREALPEAQGYYRQQDQSLRSP